MPSFGTDIESKIEMNNWYEKLSVTQKSIVERFYLQMGRKDVLRSKFYPGSDLICKNHFLKFLFYSLSAVQKLTITFFSNKHNYKNTFFNTISLEQILRKVMSYT